MTFGIDIGTTSVAGVAVDTSGRVCASVTRAHEADLQTNRGGVFEQDPLKLLAAAKAVLADLEAKAGRADAVGWTGQMHGVVGVDRELRPVTPFVTWRDSRLFGGRVMRGWAEEGREIYRCLPVCGLAQAWLTGHGTIDPTFLHAWYLDELDVSVREKVGAWLPEVVEGTMIGDNQAGVVAAERMMPGCAVVNIGTSAQLSIVLNEPFEGPALPGAAAANGLRTERRPYLSGRTLLCRAAISGGRAWADLRERLGFSWDEMNATDDPRVTDCAARIVDELVGGIDLAGVTGVIGGGNGLVKNAALRAAVERRLGCVCRLSEVSEMAAYGAAIAGERSGRGCRT